MGRCKEFDENIVLQKAMELFWQQGYEKTSMSELVACMGIHRKSLYDTFGDKHALYLSVIDFYAEQNKARLRAKVKDANTAYDAIQAIFDIAIKGNEKNWGCLFVNAATESGPWDKEVLEKIEKAFEQTEQLIGQIIRQGQEKGELSNRYDGETLAYILHNTLLGLRVLVRTSSSKEKMQLIANFYLKLLKE